MREFEIRIQGHDWGRDYSIVPVRERADGSIEIAYPKDGKWELRLFKAGEIIPDDLPVLKVPQNWLPLLSKALSEHFEVLPHATDQELKATKYHLEDLRKMIPELVGE